MPGWTYTFEPSARRKAEASGVLIGRRVADVQAALNEHGAEWIARLEREHAEAVRSWRHLLDVLGEAQAKMAAAESLRAFTRSGRWWAHAADDGVGEALGA